MTLVQQYERVVLRYIRTFCKKQDIKFDHWVGNIIGEVACCNECFLNFDDIRFDIDNNIDAGKILEWKNEMKEMRIKNKEWVEYKEWVEIDDNKFV